MLQLIHYTVTNILYTCLDTVVVISFGTICRNVMVVYFISSEREEYLEKQGKFVEIDQVGEVDLNRNTREKNAF